MNDSQGDERGGMTDSTEHPPSSWVAVVTGASRGLGRGMAIALGRLGASVYVTGRRHSDSAWPGTLDDTVAAINAAGGTGFAVPCDHGDDAQTEALFAEVRQRHGRLDILVNNAFAMPDWAAAQGRFWERPIELWHQVVDIGTRSSYTASVFAVPLMLEARRGLIVNTSGRGARVYLHGLPYGVGKAGQDKLAYDMAHELRPFGIAAVSFWCGLLQTDRTLSAIASNPEHYADRGGTDCVESPEMIGEVTGRLYQDPRLMEMSGGTYYTAELANHYGVREPDGRRPVSFRARFGAPLFETFKLEP